MIFQVPQHHVAHLMGKRPAQTARHAQGVVTIVIEHEAAPGLSLVEGAGIPAGENTRGLQAVPSQMLLLVLRIGHHATATHVFENGPRHDRHAAVGMLHEHQARRVADLPVSFRVQRVSCHL